MGMFSNPLAYTGEGPGVTGTPTTQNTTVRAATLTEANDGVLDNVYISPATLGGATAVDFASPPALGFGSTTKRPVHATTLESTSDTTLATGAGAKLGFYGATAITQPVNTTDLRTLLINLGLVASGGANPLNLNGGDLTAANVTATTGNIDATAGTVTAGTTMTAGTGITSTTGDITASAGDVVINGAGKLLKVHGGATTDYVGNATLTLGTVDIANASLVAATDRVFVTRSSINGSTALGTLEAVITDGVKFTINSYTSAAVVETNDVSKVNWFVVRQV